MPGVKRLDASRLIVHHTDHLSVAFTRKAEVTRSQRRPTLAVDFGCFSGPAEFMPRNVSNVNHSGWECDCIFSGALGGGSRLKASLYN